MVKQPTVAQLDQPAPVKDILTEQEKDYDCTPCRLMGISNFYLHRLASNCF